MLFIKCYKVLQQKLNKIKGWQLFCNNVTSVTYKIKKIKL